MRVVFDAEFDSLNPTKLWCLVAHDLDKDREHVFRFDEDTTWRELVFFSKRVSSWIGANSLLFDNPNLRRLIPGIVVRDEYPKSIDLQVVSRLIHYDREGGHGVEAWGESFGIEKPEVIEYDKPELIETYVHRCREDVRIQARIYRELARFIESEDWQLPIKVEHDATLICRAIGERGFAFDLPKAQELLAQLETEMEEVEKEIHSSIPPRVVPGKPKVLRYTKEGRPHANVAKFFGEPVPSFVDGCDFVPVTFESFNPGSHKQRIELLNAAGWQPTEKTKSHLQAERMKNGPEKEAKLAQFAVSGWKVNENNLNTLPANAPVGAKKLAEWLTLEGRRGDLAEWIANYNEHTGALHPQINHIGAWTHRKSHARPNCANIFGLFYIKNCKDTDNPTPVESVKVRYNNRLRSTWVARPDHLLVGTDAEGIQLRILAHAMGDRDYGRAVAEGRKEDETDVHNVNRRALGLNHTTRDDAKTFIYAWVLGASIRKVQEILKCSTGQAGAAVRNFLERLPALGQLKQEKIPFYARRGYFDGVDRRKVICRSEHLMLAGILQEGESTIMKHANVLWRKWADEEKIPYFQVNDVHDEWQTEVPIVSRLQFDKNGRPWTDETNRLGELQRESIAEVGRRLGVLTPLAGTTDVGWNWYETH